MPSLRARVSDGLLRAQVTCGSYAMAARNAVGRASRRFVSDEQGQTPTEYLMIVGLMAAVIVVAFVTMFWGTIRDAVSTWSGKAATAITGSEIQ